MQANASVEGVERELRSTRARSSGPHALAAIDEPAILLLRLSNRHGPGGHIEIAVDLSIKGLEKLIRGECRLEVHIQLTVDAFEGRCSGWILGKLD